MRSGLVSVACVVGVIFLVGCGDGMPVRPEPVAVEGTVTLDAKDIADGTISFFATGYPPEILDVKGGKFTGKVRPGEDLRVEFAVLAEGPKSETMPEMKPGMVNTLPAKFHANSKYTATVKAAGENKLKFELTTN